MPTCPTDRRLRVFTFSSGWGIPFESSAPFPLKLLTWLRMAGLPYEHVVADDPRKGPKGKSPWIELDGERMGDSSLIIEYLATRFDVDLDAPADLGPDQRALAVAIQRMLEEHFHQCYEHQLFYGRGGSARLTEYTSSLPIPLRWIVPRVLRRSLAKQLYARGMGRHSEDVIIAQGKADLDALAVLIGDHEFALGDTPSAIDACVFGFLGTVVYVTGDNPLFRHAATNDVLVGYCERMRERYFPETR